MHDYRYGICEGNCSDEQRLLRPYEHYGVISWMCPRCALNPARWRQPDLGLETPMTEVWEGIAVLVGLIVFLGAILYLICDLMF